jgi:hypothetical protein
VPDREYRTSSEFGRQLPRFWRNLLSVSAGCKNERRRSSGHLLFVSAPSLLIRHRFIRNVGACVPNNTASALKTVMFVVTTVRASNLAVLPHYESLSANALKDLIAVYFVMQNTYVTADRLYSF